VKNIKISLGLKIAISIGFLFVILLLAILSASKAIVQSGFTRLEEQEITTNITRFKKNIDRELEDLASTCGDWAPWDNARDFILGKEPNFINSDLTIDCLANLKINFMIFIDNEGKIVNATAIDYIKKTNIQLSPESINYILSEKTLLTIKEPTETRTGLLIMPDLQAFVAAQPISNSLIKEPICGTLIVGRFLNDALLDVLRTQTCLDIKTTKSFTTDNYKSSSEIDTFIKVLNQNTILGYTNIYDISKKKHITFQITMPRNIYNYGRNTINYFVFTMIASLLLIMAGLLFILQTIVLKPLNRLTSNFTDIAHDYNISTKLYTEREDEIGSLARSFDSMMDHLKKQILELAEKHKTTNFLNAELSNNADKLQQANTELKNFVYVASHDLREPLRQIIVFGDMLKNSMKDRLQGEEAESLYHMINGADRMKKMIDGLLDYSRVSTQLHPFETIDLNKIVVQLCQFELGVLLQEKNASIQTPQPLPFVMADATQITQLMQNIIANGIKYQKKGNNPLITITSKPASDGKVKIEVTDNGIGIKPEYHSAIFTMFKRLHTNTEYEGTGIGLAICKKIIERHEGQIGVESQPGNGSTFWFTVAAASAPVSVKA